MRKRILALLTALALASCGCIKPVPLESYGYVIAVAFDSGKQLDYNVTFMVQKPSSGSEGAKEKGFVLLSAEGDSLYEAIQTVASRTPMALNFARTAFMVFSLPLLTAEPDALKKLTDVSFPGLKIRYNVHLIVSLTDAKETLMGLENDFDASPAKLQTNFVSYADETGWIPIANLTLLNEAVGGKTFDLAVPLMGVSGEENLRAVGDAVGGSRYAYIGGRMLVETKMKTGLAGAAILNGDRVAGLIDGGHVQLLLMANGSFRSGRMRIPLPDGGALSVLLKQKKKPKRTLTLTNPASAEVEIYLNADVELPHSNLEYSPEELEKIIADGIAAAYPPLYETCRMLEADVFSFGKIAVTKFPTAAAWEEYDWPRAYKTLSASFTVQVELIHSTEKTVLE